VRGRVVSSGDQNPAPELEVRAALSHALASQFAPASITGLDGAFEIRGIEPGSYTLVAEGEGWRGELEQPIRLGLGSTVEDILIEVGEAAQVTGRVLLEKNAGAVRARVR